jgi:hypothetical protein
MMICLDLMEHILGRPRLPKDILADTPNRDPE